MENLIIITPRIFSLKFDWVQRFFSYQRTAVAAWDRRCIPFNRFTMLLC